MPRITKRIHKEKKKLFARELIRTKFNGVKATDKITTSTNYNYKRVLAARYLTDKDVIEEVKKRVALFDKNVITPEYVLAGLFKIANDIRHKDNIRALELMGKYLAMYVDKTVNQHEDITPQDKDILHKYMRTNRQFIHE